MNSGLKENFGQSGIRAGWFCAYTPVEIVEAFGLKPERIFGSPGPWEKADGILYTNLCPYVRSCLEEGLADSPPFVIFTTCCDHLRRLRDAWDYYIKPEFSYILDLPRGKDESSIQYFANSIKGLISSLEEKTGCELSAEKLRTAIVKRLEVDMALEKACKTASSAQEILRLYQLAQKSFAASELCQLLENRETYTEEDKRDASDSFAHEKKVIVSGNLLRSEVIPSLIEECGGTIVHLDLCSASRFSLWRSDTNSREIDSLGLESLLHLIARTYLSKTPCPRMSNRSERHELIVDLARTHNASGVILSPLMFCDSFLYDIPLLLKKLEPLGIPLLVLESDYRDENVGGIRTRVEAFVEML